VVPEGASDELTVVGNTFAYGARAGRAYIAGRGGNRFGICLRKSHEGEGPRIVVEGVEANAFQYMTGGIALVLGPVGFNLGAGLTGGRVYLYDLDGSRLNRQYVRAEPARRRGRRRGAAAAEGARRRDASRTGKRLLKEFDPARFSRVTTSLSPSRSSKQLVRTRNRRVRSPDPPVIHNPSAAEQQRIHSGLTTRPQDFNRISTGNGRDETD
jgi:glutamate synthase domain-containing protein 3